MSDQPRADAIAAQRGNALYSKTRTHGVHHDHDGDACAEYVVGDCILAALAPADQTADLRAAEQDIEVLRAAAWRLCEAVADKAAADGLYASGHAGWKQAMDADDEYMAALRALRTACDGRPRP